METKTNELIQVVEQSGLYKTKGQKITETLSVFFDKAAEWQTVIESLTINSIEEVGKMKTAKEIRLSLKNKRLEGEKLVKAAREIVKARMADDVLEDKLWLKSGQVMTAVYDNLESKAEWIEKYAERYEAEQKEIRKSERTTELTPYSEFVPFGIDLGNMPDEDYTKVLEGAKLQLNAKIEAEAKAETERLENIRLENERIEKQRIENERLKAEAIEREKQIEAERVEREAEEVKAKQERERIQKEADDKLAEEKRKSLELENQLKAEKQKELDRIEAERINAENERLEREKAAEAELSKGDAAKMNDLIKSIESLTTAYVFKSKKHQTIQASINDLLIKTANYAKSKV